MKRHPFNKTKIGLRIFILKNRIGSIRKDILYLAILSFVSIIAIEFWLINIPAPFKFFYSFGVIYLKLSYSFLSAFLFYFLVVHLPKERRKLKSFRILSNKIHLIDSLIFNIMHSLFKWKLERQELYTKTAKEITDAAMIMNPNSPVTGIGFGTGAPGKILYVNWYEFLNDTMSKINDTVRDILLLNESVDSDLLEALTHLSDTTKWLIFNNKNNNSTLQFASHSLIDIRNDCERLSHCFSKAYNKFTIEYHIAARKKNRELIKEGKL